MEDGGRCLVYLWLCGHGVCDELDGCELGELGAQTAGLLREKRRAYLDKGE